LDLKNLQQIMQMSTQLQSRMKDMQETLVQQRYTVSSGGGLVEATVDGKGTVVAVRIDPKAADPTDVEMLEDLVLAAVTQAQKRANQAMEAEMKRATGGLSLPGLGSLLGS
jgi:DNA-binding YbaB/EbfC family protein